MFNTVSVQPTVHDSLYCFVQLQANCKTATIRILGNFSRGGGWNAFYGPEKTVHIMSGIYTGHNLTLTMPFLGNSLRKVHNLAQLSLLVDKDN